MVSGCPDFATSQISNRQLRVWPHTQFLVSWPLLDIVGLKHCQTSPCSFDLLVAGWRAWNDTVLILLGMHQVGCFPVINKFQLHASCMVPFSPSLSYSFTISLPLISQTWLVASISSMHSSSHNTAFLCRWPHVVHMYLVLTKKWVWIAG